MEKKRFGLAGVIICSIMLCALVNILMIGIADVKPEVTLYDEYVVVQQTEAYEAIKNNAITSAMIVDDYLYFETEDALLKSTYDQSMVDVLTMQGMLSPVAKSTGPSTLTIVLAVVLGVILLFGIIIAISFHNASKQLDAMMKNAGPRKVMTKEDDGPTIKKTRPNVRFEDVQGIDGIKTEIENAVDCLKNPQAYVEIGAKAKKGILLCGAPGTGKTLLAKAMAGEAGVPFLSANGSDFIEKYVGVGASRIRELYAEARKCSPCIVFIDEIDAIGGERGDAQNSERDQTINALLTELDGFDGTEGILTIAATNRLDMLDSALTRPGRFDLTLTVNLPDKEGRYQILKRHARNKKLSMEIDLKNIAARTVGFSGAALEALLNESAHIAVANKRKYISPADVDDAFFKIVMKGSKKKLDKTNEDFKKTNEIIAWHEAGHALVTKLLTDDSVPVVTIIGSTSGAGGVTFMSPKENVLHSKKDIKNRIKVSYAGRAAEQVLLQDDDLITTGASSDIRQATKAIRGYLAVYGMGKNGMLNMESFHADKEILPEATKMANELYSETLTLLNNNKETLRKIAEALIEKETIDEEVLDNIIFGKKEEVINPCETNAWKVDSND